MSFFDDLGERTEPARDRTGGRVAWWTILGVLVLAVGAYAALAWYADGITPRRASVEGVDIGGLPTAEARAVLRRELTPQLDEPVVLTHEGDEVTIVPADAGVTVDVAESILRAGGGSSWTPKELWDHYTGIEDSAAVLSVDPAGMSRVLDGVTERFDTLAVEGSLDFSSGRAEPVYGKPGLRVDREATADLLQRVAFDDATSHELPVERRHPYISGTAVQQALNDFGRPAMSGPVFVLIGPARVVVPPRVIGQALTMIPSSGQLKPLLDVRKLRELLEPRMTTVGEKPRNAFVRVADGRLETVKARTGAVWDDAELEQGLLEALVRPRGERRFRLQAALSEPRVDDEAVARWGIREELQTISVELGEVDDETRAEVARLDNRRIPAGKEFSFAESVTDDGVGERPSVVGAALFATAYRLGLEIEQFTPPMRRDPRLPVGMDVRVDADHDLVLRNTTPYSVLVSAILEEDTLRVSLWSTPHFVTSVVASESGQIVAAGTRRKDSANCIPRRPRDGFTVTMARTLTAPSGDASRDRLVARYAPREGVTC